MLNMAHWFEYPQLLPAMALNLRLKSGLKMLRNWTFLPSFWNVLKRWAENLTIEYQSKEWNPSADLSLCRSTCKGIYQVRQTVCFTLRVLYLYCGYKTSKNNAELLQNPQHVDFLHMGLKWQQTPYLTMNILVHLLRGINNWNWRTKLSAYLLNQDITCVDMTCYRIGTPYRRFIILNHLYL